MAGNLGPVTPVFSSLQGKAKVLISLFKDLPPGLAVVWEPGEELLLVPFLVNSQCVVMIEVVMAKTVFVILMTTMLLPYNVQTSLSQMKVSSSVAKSRTPKSLPRASDLSFFFKSFLIFFICENKTNQVSLPVWVFIILNPPSKSSNCISSCLTFK